MQKREARLGPLDSIFIVIPFVLVAVYLVASLPG